MAWSLNVISKYPEHAAGSMSQQMPGPVCEPAGLLCRMTLYSLDQPVQNDHLKILKAQFI